MAMNAIHRRICRSDAWSEWMHGSVLPWATGDVDLAGEVLEIGPGYGVTTRWLAPRTGSLTAVEVDGTMAADLAREVGGSGVDVRHGDGAGLPFPDGYVIHIGDTMTGVDPGELPGRLRTAGLDAPPAEVGERSFRFRARRG
jgi:SAM-dependent methyltransferase